MKKIMTSIVILCLLFMTAVTSVNAVYINNNINKNSVSFDVLGKQENKKTLSGYDVTIGAIYLWLEANLSTKEFCYFRYGQDNNHILMYVEFLKEDVNDDSYIKWGTLLNNPIINPSIFYHKNTRYYYYYWIQIERTFKKNVKYSNGRILIKADGLKGVILLTCADQPEHNLSVPRNPAIIGSFYGKPGLEYEYTFFSRSYNDSALFYYIDWGDGNNSGWIGPYQSCKEFTLTHMWSSQGIYKIKAVSKDIFGNESPWTTLEFDTSKNNKAANSFSPRFLDVFSLLKRLLFL